LLLPFLLDFEVEEEPFWGPVFSWLGTSFTGAPLQTFTRRALESRTETRFSVSGVAGPACQSKTTTDHCDDGSA
jgi:hypothetical protein